MSSVELVEHAVMADLLGGRLPPGSRIRQDELADRLGVSKIPVREALQRLAATGVVALEPNRGAVVPCLTVEGAVENFALRRAIEPLLLERALANLTIVDLAVAEHALDGAIASATVDARANWAFHRAIYAPSHWRRGLAVAEMLHAAVAPYVVLYTADLDGAATSDDEHRALLDACRHRDRDRATALLTRHLDAAAEAVTAHLDDGARREASTSLE